ncbi:MAG: hypothetical protein ACP5E5_09555, partial [Acidobacteriaceae bacterium]
RRLLVKSLVEVFASMPISATAAYSSRRVTGLQPMARRVAFCLFCVFVLGRAALRGHVMPDFCAC